ncbi:MAG: antA/AntB antirepressor family protein [Moraxella sp.]|nr:antA/AntB antirepressor family protein [Moraxella sp.]
MTNLPQVQGHKTLTQAVNARELHAFLQNKDHFATWIKDRISQYDFQENQDFVIFSENSEKGRPRLEYAITLDMAKELSMVERNEQGKQARKYFIECEKRLKANLPSTYIEALEALLESEKQKQALQDKITHDAPKVRHYDLVADRTNLMNASQVGSKVGLTAVNLNKFLDERGVYNKAIKRNKRTFNHWFISKGYGKMIQTEQGYDQAVFTHTGEAWVIEQITSEGVVA